MGTLNKPPTTMRARGCSQLHANWRQPATRFRKSRLRSFRRKGSLCCLTNPANQEFCMATAAEAVKNVGRGRVTARMLDALIFIDTNIFLDFYRVRGWEAGLSVLNHICSNYDRIITGNQIEMEYKKNRQKVILESLGKAKSPDWGGLSVPTFLQESKPNQALERAKKQVDTQMKRMRARIEAVLRTPGTTDPVFHVAQALFKADSPLNLSREKDARYRIRRLALKRFMLGYPPRKESDTSVGDAINWEWIVRCASDTGKHVIIVSRDSDYGHIFQKTPILNDWLSQEFRERVSKRRTIILTDRLTEAFKRISVPVTRQEEAQEEALIEESTATVMPPGAADLLSRLLTPDEQQVVSLAFGLADQKRRSPDEVAIELGMTRQDVVRVFRGASVKLVSGVKGATTKPG